MSKKAFVTSQTAFATSQGVCAIANGICDVANRVWDVTNSVCDNANGLHHCDLFFNYFQIVLKFKKQVTYLPSFKVTVRLKGLEFVNSQRPLLTTYT